jgi:hypothetical protein
MKKHQLLYLFTLALALLLIGGALFVSSAHAGRSMQSASQQNASAAQFEPGNYCESCHSAEDPMLKDQTAWRGGIEAETISPCPAITRLHEEQYYTERMLLAVDNAKSQIPASLYTASMGSRQTAASETYSRLLDMPVESLDAYVSEAQGLRYSLGKVYTQINQAADSAKRTRVLIFGLLVTLVVLASLGWGMYNTRHVMADKKSSKRLSYYALRGIFLLLIFALFVLPLFRTTSQQTASASTEIQNTLDAAQRFATAAGRADGRAWMFSQVGAAWNPLDQAQAQKALDDALEAAGQSEMNAFALWGEAANAREVSVSEPVLLEKAGLIADQLNAARSRAWALGLIGSEWSQVDPARAEEIFETAAQTSDKGQGIYRDLDLHRIASAWSKSNLQKAEQISSAIADPAIQSWTLRELAAESGSDDLFTQAVEAARRIENPFQRARALSKIAQLNGDPQLFSEALTQLEGQQRPELAYAQAGLSADSGNAALIEQIDPAYPAARALALIRLALYPEAWETSKQIVDPYDRARAQADIVAGWVDQDALQAAAATEQISVPMLRDRAMRDVIAATGDASLAQKLSLAYYRVQALTTLGQYPSAWEQAAGLKDTYPLAALGMAWAKTDPKSAEQVLDKLDREADKAVVLRQLAVESGDQETFERALGMALAARVRGDALAPARASLELAVQFLFSAPEKAQAALNQAYEVTQKISIK